MVSGAPVDKVAAPLTVTLPPPPLCTKALPVPPDIESVAKVRVPEVLPLRLTAFPPTPVQEVLPKLILAVEVEVTMHSLLLPETVVEPKATVPATLVRVRPEVLLDVVVTLVKADVAANVPVVRLSVWPVPSSVMSGVVMSPTVSVPKLVPAILAPVVLLIVKPRKVLPCARL